MWCEHGGPPDHFVVCSNPNTTKAKQKQNKSKTKATQKQHKSNTKAKHTHTHTHTHMQACACTHIHHVYTGRLRHVQYAWDSGWFFSDPSTAFTLASGFSSVPNITLSWSSCHACVCNRKNDVKKNDVRRNDVRRNDVRVLQTPSSPPCVRANSCNVRSKRQTKIRKRVAAPNMPGSGKSPTLAAVFLEKA